MTWLSVALLALSVLAVIGAEWPRLAQRVGLEAFRKRKRTRRKAQLRLLRGSDTDDFAASVERDLEQLPTLEDFDRR